MASDFAFNYKETTMKESRNPQGIHPPIGTYAHQIEVRGNERLLVISGQVGMREDGTVPDDPLEQIDIAFENILRNLHAAGMDVRDLIKMNYYLVGEFDTARRRELIASRLEGHKPCSTLVYVAALANPVFKVEIEAWASHAD
jgi:enamine deaminase RidA (YjgF/YER057c/UK114 family)